MPIAEVQNSGSPSEALRQQVARGATHRRDILTLLPSMSEKMIKTRAVTMTSSQAKRASGCCQMVVVSRMGENPWCVIHSPNAAKGEERTGKTSKEINASHVQYSVSVGDRNRH